MMRVWESWYWLTMAALTGLLGPLAARAEDGQTTVGDAGVSAEAVIFEREVLPILTARCGKCHSSKVQKGGLDLSSIEAVNRGGESGEKLVDESLDESLLWQMIDGGSMPPDGEPRLSDTETELIRRWLETGAASEAGASEMAVTQHDVLPFLYARCVVCHGARQQQGGLDLRSVESILKGGKSGPAAVAGQPENSLILKRVHSRDMPPPTELIRAGVRPMESSEIELLTAWIRQGAREHDIALDIQTTELDPLVTDEDRDFWSFRTPQRPIVPDREALKQRAMTLLNEQAAASGSIARNTGGDPVVDQQRYDISSPVDAFLLERLLEQRLLFSPRAERLHLIRRVAFDLTGLPPEWSDVQRFQNDKSPEWYATMVDYYLDSTAYGERWSRYWLDLCGYADSEGKRSADPIRDHAWRYRDYVIRSFNSNKPYDRFLLEQIAGDELYDFNNADSVTPELEDALVATGYLRMAPDGTGSDIVDTVAERFEVVADEIEILGSSVLGLTLKCAQCHSHKYDPIPQRDYYRLVAVFSGAYDVYDWLKPVSVPNQSKNADAGRRFLPMVRDEVRAEWESERDAVEASVTLQEQDFAKQVAEARDRLFMEKLASVPESIREDVRQAVLTVVNERSDEQRQLIDQYAKGLPVDDAAVVKAVPKLAAERKSLDKTIADLRSKLAPEPMVRALWDRGEPSPTWLFRRGEFTNPGQPVGPGVLSVLTDGRTPFEVRPRRPDSTGRRLAFAEWLTDRRHPLTARVFVNRVWFHHFGRGLVESLANFGRTGTPPTHPELLDWLAVEFMSCGWDIKQLHRTLMLTTAYRQSSLFHPEHEESDPDNRWLSRMPLRRLEAEAVRDSLLFVSGRLNRDPFGRPDNVTVRDDGLVTALPAENGWRRTIYIQQRRKEIPTILETFDLPQMIPNCTERPNSTVASQALHLLNNGHVRELCIAMAVRLSQEAGDDRYQQVRRLYQVALCREPEPAEMQIALEVLQEIAERWRTTAASKSSTASGSDGPGGTSSSDVRPQNVSPDTLALANLCHVILNSAEFLFVD